MNRVSPVGGLAQAAEQVARWIHEADRVVIGAGSGLSAAAGLDFGDEADFAARFPALVRRGLKAAYQMIGYSELSEAAFWGFWSVHVTQMRFADGRSPVYEGLLRLVREKDCFVLDHERRRDVRSQRLRSRAGVVDPGRLRLPAVPATVHDGCLAERARPPARLGRHRSGHAGGGGSRLRSALHPLRRQRLHERARRRLVPRGAVSAADGEVAGLVRRETSRRTPAAPRHRLGIQHAFGRALADGAHRPPGPRGEDREDQPAPRRSPA